MGPFSSTDSMGGLNKLELERKFEEDEAYTQSLRRFFILHTHYKNGILPAGFSPSKALVSSLHLTSAGEHEARRMQQQIDEVTEEVAKFSLLRRPFYDDIFIDPIETDLDELENALEADIVGKKLSLPYVFGRHLYDEFFERFPGRTSRLEPEETEELLKETPYGVFQMGEIVSGPFGLLESAECRTLNPTRCPPLWHCSDPSCGAFHGARLSNGHSVAESCYSEFRTHLANTDRVPSDWVNFCIRLTSDENYYSDRHHETLPWLIGNALSGTEIRTLLTKALGSQPHRLRDQPGRKDRFSDFFQDGAHEIASKIGEAGALQLILQLDNASIIEALEELILAEEIEIPFTETRRPVFWSSPLPYADSTSKKSWTRTANYHSIVYEAARFGVRAVSTSKSLGPLRMRRLIEAIHSSPAEMEDLEFRLRHQPGGSVYERLEHYLRETEPLQVLQELVVTGHSWLSDVKAHLSPGHYPRPATKEDEEELLRRILWKLGFDVGIYPPTQRIFWDRLTRFEAAARKHAGAGEQGNEKIRSAGSNFFVSLEDVLEKTLSYATWALLSDHFGETRFHFNSELARERMAEELNARQKGKEDPIRFDPDGKNTLFPLVAGFSILEGACREIIEEREREFPRADDEFPGYHGKTSIQVFPWKHTKLVLDLSERTKADILDILASVTKRLEKAGVASLRNRIEHRREDFPRMEEILSVCEEVRDVISELEEHGLSPLIHYFGGSDIDHRGQGEIRFRNYADQERILFQPSLFYSSGLPGTAPPQVVSPVLRIRGSLEPLRFTVEEPSEFNRKWEDFPRWRSRMGPLETEGLEGGQQEATDAPSVPEVVEDEGLQEQSRPIYYGEDG